MHGVHIRKKNFFHAANASYFMVKESLLNKVPTQLFGTYFQLEMIFVMRLMTRPLKAMFFFFFLSIVLEISNQI